MDIIRLYIAFTFFTSVFLCGYKKRNDILLHFILLVCFGTEIISYIFSSNNIGIDITYSISFILNGALWIAIIARLLENEKAMSLLLAAFLLFSLTNFFFFEGPFTCNFNTFIVGALVYVALFIYISFQYLKRENLWFFNSNNFILLFSPVLFFLGLSFIFGFKSETLAKTKIFEFQLYDIIGVFSNLTYYSLINIYIYLEKKHPSKTL